MRSFTGLESFIRPEWIYFVPALLGIILAGLCMPYLAVILVDAKLVFFYDDYDMVMDEVKIACFHFVGVGIVELLGTTVSACANGVLSEGVVKRLRVAILRHHQISAGRFMCVSEVSVDVCRRRRRAWRGHVFTIGPWPYKFWVSFGVQCLKVASSLGDLGQRAT